MKHETVLSFSANANLLIPRERALRDFGYRVVSTTSEACVRFEIQMGQCGVLLLCYTHGDAIHADLTELFKRFCESGVVAFVMHPTDQERCKYAHICFVDEELPAKLHLIRRLQDEYRKSA